MPFEPEEGVELLWHLDDPLYRWRFPTEGRDGTIFAVRFVYDSPGSTTATALQLVRLSPSGDVGKTVDVPKSGDVYPPAIRQDGVIVLASDAFDSELGVVCGPVSLRAYSPDLELLWTFTDQSPLRVTVAIRADNVTMARVGARLLAISPDGELLWSRSVGTIETCGFDASPMDGAVIVGPGNISYTFGQDNTVYAFSPEREELWKTQVTGISFWKRLVPTEGGLLFVPGETMPVLSLRGEVVNTLPKGGDHHIGLSGVGDVAIVTGTGHPQGYTSTKKIWGVPTGKIVDPAIGFRTTKGLIIGGASGMSSKADDPYTHPTVRVIDAQTGAIVAEHFGSESGSFAIRVYGSILLDDGTVIAPGGISGDYGLYAIRFPYGGLAKTGWPVVFGDNQHSNRFRLAQAVPPP